MHHTSSHFIAFSVYSLCSDWGSSSGSDVVYSDEENEEFASFLQSVQRLLLKEFSAAASH